MKKYLKIILAIIVVATFVSAPLCSFGQSGIPQIVAFQGFLSQSGTPVTNTNPGIPASFTLYGSESGSDEVWHQNQDNVKVDNGYYTAFLDLSKGWEGGRSDGGDYFTKQYWLQILINGNNLGARVKLASTPYAINARRADTATFAARAGNAKSADSTGIALKLVQDAPVGTIVAYGGSSLNLSSQKKSGWFLCNGQRVHKDEFPLYASQVGTIYGTDGGDSINIPDLRGLFLRGVNAGRSDNYKDPDDRIGGDSFTKIGSLQMDTLKSHSHQFPHHYYATGQSNNMVMPAYNNPGASEPNTIEPTTGGSETRPKNAAVYWLIKVK